MGDIADMYREYEVSNGPDDGPGVTFCAECGKEISEDDTGNIPFCGNCYTRIYEEYQYND
jgi:hypothetical protein